MNNIIELKIRRESAERIVGSLRQGIADLKSYLLRDKFFADPTVQVADVLRRLSDIENAALDAQVQYENGAYEALRRAPEPPKSEAYIIWDENSREYSAYTLGDGDFLGKHSRREALKRRLLGYRFS